jgi:hypothetical protein
MLAFSLAALVPLADRTPDPDGERIAAGLALVVLALLWMFALRVFAQLRWTRRVGRAGITLAATVEGRTGRTIDASPSGPPSCCPCRPAAGDRVEVRSPSRRHGDHDGRRGLEPARRGGHEIVASPSTPIRAPRQWIRLVFDELHLDGTWCSTRRRGWRPAALSGGGSGAIGLTVAVSLVVSACCCSTLGYRTLVVRSNSMAPRCTPATSSRGEHAR